MCLVSKMFNTLKYSNSETREICEGKSSVNKGKLRITAPMYIVSSFISTRSQYYICLAITKIIVKN
jgi:hypothetical protein